jgi:SAM-dependent methyltransferase
MILKSKYSKLRGELFRHLDGIVTAPTAYVLYKRGVTEYLLKNKNCSLKELTKQFNAKEGYLNVSLRILCSQGWLIQNIDNQKDFISYSTSKSSNEAFKHFYLYKDATNLLNSLNVVQINKITAKQLIQIENLYLKLKNNHYIENFIQWKSTTIKKQFLSHIKGILIGPIVVHLGMNNVFHNYFMESNFNTEGLYKDPEIFKKLIDILTHFGWFTKKNLTLSFTEKGLFYAKRATAYGVTVSYIPTLMKLNDIIFGQSKYSPNSRKNITEKHVDRKINVWGSGGAHANYFKVVDDIIINQFNKPIENQPKGILDLGCGNGSFLIHLFNVIEQRTVRGKILDEYPLTLIGVDYNKTALKISKNNLIKADIWANVIWGDVGKSKILARNLKNNYNIDLTDLLNVRAFLDHNRMWEMPKKYDRSRISYSTGAFSFKGVRLNNNSVEEFLIEHFKNWRPFVEKFGLIIIELHTLDPKLVAKNLGRTAATAYDATHGYSDQYIVELDVFNKILKESGFLQDLNSYKVFPNSNLATVSINYLRTTPEI